MRNDEIAGLYEEARDALAEHWQGAMDSGLEDITPAAVKEALELLEGFADALSALPDPAPERGILLAIERLMKDLNDLNERQNGGMLETDEREMICAFVNEAAETAGLELDKFDDGDPTQEWREF